MNKYVLCPFNLRLLNDTNADHVRFVAEFERTFKKYPIKNFDAL